MDDDVYVALHAEDTAFLWANHLAEQYAKSPIVGKLAVDLVHPQERQKVVDAYARAHLLNKMQPCEFTSPAPDKALYRSHIYPVSGLGRVRFVCVVRRVPKAVALLTKREQVVCRFVGNGLETAEIAKLLKIKRPTADTHRNNARRKLKLAGVKFVAWCVEHKHLL